MKQLLVFVLLVVASFGLPGVLDIGKLFSGGLLDGVEKMLTNKDASPQASAGSSQSSDMDTMQSRGEPNSQSMSLGARSSAAAGLSTGSANRQHSISGNDGIENQEPKPPQSPEHDNLQQSATFSPSATPSTTTPESMDEGTNKAEAEEVSTSSPSGGPKTVVHTQFVVVAPGGPNTLLISEPESFSAVDNSAYTVPLSPLSIAAMLLPLALFCQ
ncbi:hypothetical protein GGI20_003686 [Coemansia sp. BCRC 34301]|nr:hypothetical protein GGI20_003686 [Coemansia sp. BCRC 34301]